MKKLFALLLALTMAFALCACGGGGGDGGDAAKVTGETVSTTGFSVLVPEGWTYELVNGDSGIYLYKGEKDTENNLVLCPMVSIASMETAYDHHADADRMFEEYEDIQPLTTGDLTWQGVTGTYLDVEKAFLWTEGEAHYYVNMDLSSDQGSISLKDADVLDILGSVQAVG